MYPNFKVCITIKVLNQFLDFFLLIYNLCVCVYVMVDFEMIFYFSFLDFAFVCIECSLD
jgi:hypothetical protein